MAVVDRRLGEPIEVIEHEAVVVVVRRCRRTPPARHAFVFEVVHRVAVAVLMVRAGVRRRRWTRVGQAFGIRGRWPGAAAAVLVTRVLCATRAAIGSDRLLSVVTHQIGSLTGVRHPLRLITGHDRCWTAGYVPPGRDLGQR